jgi:hypothetical protein
VTSVHKIGADIVSPVAEELYVTDIRRDPRHGDGRGLAVIAGFMPVVAFATGFDHGSRSALSRSASELLSATGINMFRQTPAPGTA